MELNQLLDDLKEKFYHNNTFLKHANASQESVLQTIKSYFLKKNLVIVSKAEFDKLLEFKEKQYLKDLSQQEDLY